MLFTLLWVPKTSNWILTPLENYCTDASHAAKSNRIEIITPWLFTWRSSEYKNLHVQSGGCNFAGQTINMWKKLQVIPNAVWLIEAYGAEKYVIPFQRSRFSIDFSVKGMPWRPGIVQCLIGWGWFFVLDNEVKLNPQNGRLRLKWSIICDHDYYN